MSKYITQTGRPQTIVKRFVNVMRDGRSRLIHESSGLKRDWLRYIKLFSVKKS